MSYARRHSTNVCPGNRVRYSRVYKVALAYPVVSTGHQMWCTQVVRPPFPGNLREFQRQFTTEGVCQQYFAVCR